MAGGAEIDDAQTRMSKNADAVRRRPKAAIIRTSMGNAGNHSYQLLPGSRGPSNSVRQLCRTYSCVFCCHNTYNFFLSISRD